MSKHKPKGLAIMLAFVAAIMVLTGTHALQAAEAAKSSGSTPKPPQTVVLEALASEMGTDIYRTFFGVADILKRTGSWVRMSPIESPGTQYNIEYLAKLDPDRKRTTIINTSDTGYWLGREGKRPYTKKHSNLRVIGGFNVTAVNWVTLDPNIKKLPDDIIGKRMGVFPAKFAQAPYWDILIDQVWRIKDKAKFTRILFNPAADALRDGTLDAVLMGTRMGKGDSWDLHTTLQEVLVKHKVYPLSLPKDDVAKVAKIARLPIRTQELPAGTYGPHQTQPVNGMRIVTIVMTCDASMDEAVTYALVKTMVENRKQFSQYVTYGDHVSAALLVDLAPIEDISEFHPGALKYYREVGVIK